MRKAPLLLAVLLLGVSCPSLTKAQVELERELAGHWRTVEKPQRIPATDAPRLASGPFTISLWAKSEEVADRLPGDLVCQYDVARRRGFHLSLKTNAGVTSNQANWRHLQFGIDDNRASEWRDCGQPAGSAEKAHERR